MKNRKTKASSTPPILPLICRALDDKKAEDIRVLQVTELSSITDYLVVATGTSDPHLRALRVELEKVLDSSNVHIVGMDTSQESGWLVIDAFDVMIHVMTPENRQKYALENLWKDAREVPLSDIVEGEKPKPAKKRAPAKKKPASSAATKRRKKPSAEE
jgi:ribosome-associated protein